MDGNYSQTGVTTFSTGTGAISLNGATTLSSTLTITGANDLTLDNAGSELKIRESGGAAFYAILDAGAHGADATYTLSGEQERY